MTFSVNALCSLNANLVGAIVIIARVYCFGGIAGNVTASAVRGHILPVYEHVVSKCSERGISTGNSNCEGDGG